MTSEIVNIGEANFDAKVVHGHNATLIFEDGVQESLQKPVNNCTVRADRAIPLSGSASGVVIQMVYDHAETLNDSVDGLPGYGVTVVFAQPDTFQAIRASSLPPKWAGVYTTWNGTVVYNTPYVVAALSDEPYGDEKTSPQGFYEEMKHEMWESYVGHQAFGLDEEMMKHFWAQALWYFEGLSESIGRNMTGLTDDEFKSRVQNTLTAFPDFGTASINESFWQYDQSPTPSNLCYQYSRRFMRILSPILNAQLAKRENRDPSEYRPFEAAYWAIHKAVERYKAGIRETITNTLSVELGVTLGELERLEKEWKNSLGVAANK